MENETQHPEPIILELSASQYVALEKFFEHVSSEASNGRPGMLLAQIGYQDRTKMRIGFLPYEKAQKFAVGSGWTVTREDPSPDSAAGDEHG